MRCRSEFDWYSSVRSISGRSNWGYTGLIFSNDLLYFCREDSMVALRMWLRYWLEERTFWSRSSRRRQKRLPTSCVSVLVSFILCDYGCRHENSIKCVCFCFVLGFRCWECIFYLYSLWDFELFFFTKRGTLWRIHRGVSVGCVLMNNM